MPSAAKTKREVVSEFRRGEILQAAREAFAQKGFELCTMDDMAERAGIAKGTLYLYFRSKRDIYFAALRQGVHEVNQETADRLVECSTVEQKIRTFVTTRVEYFERHRDFFRIYYSELSNLVIHQAAVRKDLVDLYWHQARTLELVLREAAQQGILNTDRTESTALLIFDMTRGVIAHRLLGWSKAAVQEDIEFLFGFIWRGIICSRNSA